MDRRDRWRIRLEAWRDSPTCWLVVTAVGVLVVLCLAMRVVA